MSEPRGDRAAARPGSRRLTEGDVCERRLWRMKRAIRRGSGRNFVSVCEQKISGTATGTVFAPKARNPIVPQAHHTSYFFTLTYYFPPLPAAVSLRRLTKGKNKNTSASSRDRDVLCGTTLVPRGAGPSMRGNGRGRRTLLGPIGRFGRMLGRDLRAESLPPCTNRRLSESVFRVTCLRQRRI